MLRKLHIASVIITIVILFTSTQKSAAQTIGDSYANYPDAGRLVNIAGTPQIIGVTYNFVPGGNSSIYLTISATVPFDLAGPGNNGSGIQNSTPNRVIIPYPYCGLQTFRIVSESPALCQGGRLEYGEEDIVSVTNGSVVDGSSAAALINGVTVYRRDLGGSQITMGTLVYRRAATCPNTEPTFQVVLELFGMADVGYPLPVIYVDSTSSIQMPVTTFGLNCSYVPRAATSPSFDPAPVILPVCKVAFTPSYPGTNLTYYNEIYNDLTNPITGLNPFAIVYIYRVENLPSDVYIRAAVQQRRFSPSPYTLNYPAIAASFNKVIYFTFDTQLPNILRWCPYFSSCNPETSSLQYQEAYLEYLEFCNCTQNIICGPGDAALINIEVNRTSLPFFDNPVGFTNPPSCAFSFNAERNLSNPITNLQFTLLSLVTGGITPYIYDWSFVSAPASLVTFLTASTVQNPLVIIGAPGLYTAQLTVTGNNGYTSTCQRTINVVGALPIVQMIPSTNPSSVIRSGQYFSITIQVGESVTLDASSSINPLGGPLAFQWAAYTLMNSSVPISISSNAAPAIGVTGLFPGSGYVLLNVSNAAGVAWLPIYFTVKQMSVSPSTPSSPFTIPLAPTTTCFAPSQNNTIPFFEPQEMPPLGNLPYSPSSPQTLTPAQISPSSGILPPWAEISSGVGAFAIVFSILILFVIVGAPLIKQYIVDADPEERVSRRPAKLD